MNQDRKMCRTGYIAFFFSGICSISSGVIVSILQEKYGFSFAVTGTMLSFMSIGNMLASFMSGILPNKIGTRMSALLLCAGYFVGYFLMAFTGIVPILIGAFALAGIAKGGTINNCTVLVGNHSRDRAKGMSLLHACYACGALLCPFLIAFLYSQNSSLPMIGVGLCGFGVWITFQLAGLPGKTKAGKRGKEKLDFAFLRDKKFWLLTGLVFCQNAAEISVTGWLVTYYKDSGILTGNLAAYALSIMWGATLIARLLIAFVIPIRNTFRALSIMGFFCTVLYGVLMAAQQPLPAAAALFAFSFAIAGVNPIAVAGVGKQLTVTSMGVLLPIAGIGAILMPWVIGVVADGAGLRAGMVSNLIPCAGIFILSMILLRKESMKESRE